jgi:hypothetical protein
MPFMVIYSTSAGASCHEQVDAIDETALFVERLRNQDGIEEIHIFRMEEISFAFRPYYKVELGMPERLVTDSPPPEVFGTTVAHVAEGEITSELEAALDAGVDDSDPMGANGRRGLFGR